MSAWKSRGLVAALILFASLFVDAAFNEAEALRPRGVWSATVSYALDDLVILRGSTWRSKHASNLNKLPGSTAPSTAADWEVFASGFNPLTGWISTRTYQRNDLIIFQGSTWRALRTNLNKTPGLNPSDWQLFAARGATGPQGPQGPQGVPGSTAVGNGTAAAPAFKFTSSPDTGMFSPGGGKLALVENGALFLHDIGTDNLALGNSALSSNTTGQKNLAVGATALLSNTQGSNNVAVGLTALAFNSTGNSNTAVGGLAMQANTAGSRNTALGNLALLSNEVGNDNTAVGYQALQVSTASNNSAFGRDALLSNTTGADNTALGMRALRANIDGVHNTAVGRDALVANAGGFNNTAVGYFALSANSAGNGNTAVGTTALLFNTGNMNTAVGDDALSINSSGSSNVAVGAFALPLVSTGSNNVAIGANAGFSAANPSNSIFIKNNGAAGDTTTIKIGTQGTQTSAFIAGISGVTVSNSAAVLINTTTGQLGTISSSRRYKEDIHAMGAMSDMLSRLRPVSFRYKKPYADGSKPLQYGLIAEEVAEVFPYLAVYNAQGQPETVKYHELPTFLLEGFQEQQRVIAQQQATIAAQAEELVRQRTINDSQAEELAEMQSRLAAIEALLQPATITAASAARSGGWSLVTGVGETWFIGEPRRRGFLTREAGEGDRGTRWRGRVQTQRV